MCNKFDQSSEYLCVFGMTSDTAEGLIIYFLYSFCATELMIQYMIFRTVRALPCPKYSNISLWRALPESNRLEGIQYKRRHLH